MRIEELAGDGLQNFRQTDARSCTTEPGRIVSGSFSDRLLLRSQHVSSSLALGEIFRKQDLFSPAESVEHNLLTALLFERVLALGLVDRLRALDESGMGNPPCIEMGGQRVSQDMLNAVIEFGAVQEGGVLGPTPVLMEIGAGWGRTAYCFLKLIPRARYVVVEIPPALFIAQHFLSAQFPGRKIFAFRPFGSHAEVAGEFEAADIAFLMPHQLGLIGKASVDVCIAIGCLEVMTGDRIEFFFRHVDRVARNLYLKWWLDTDMPSGGVRYPSLPGWRKEYERTGLLPTEYVEAFFRIAH
jgi:putative sugar O-methyltransferase